MFHKNTNNKNEQKHNYFNDFNEATKRIERQTQTIETLSRDLRRNEDELKKAVKLNESLSSKIKEMEREYLFNIHFWLNNNLMGEKVWSYTVFIGASNKEERKAITRYIINNNSNIIIIIIIVLTYSSCIGRTI